MEAGRGVEPLAGLGRGDAFEVPDENRVRDVSGGGIEPSLAPYGDMEVGFKSPPVCLGELVEHLQGLDACLEAEPFQDFVEEVGVGGFGERAGDTTFFSNEQN